MKLLLDTHAFVWWDSDPNQLSAPALAALRDPANEVLLSVASVWEMVVNSKDRTPELTNLSRLSLSASTVF